ncbi:hypothetical protein T4D_886 [Trichinella pseudospiralis]|uniref:Uncharacterized protein n=1 Tax=Trichinella pseudospiralis TaxID=6337 RepID=A0A0V1G467_TRIPS|nr:hypothetical protein T4D_886 [Trichinella pseudospiralis]
MKAKYIGRMVSSNTSEPVTARNFVLYNELNCRKWSRVEKKKRTTTFYELVDSIEKLFVAALRRKRLFRK